MKKIGKVILISFGCLFLLAASIPVIWNIRHAYYEPKKEEAMRFCESLVPMIEAAKKNGVYPKEIKPEWIKDKKVPQLVRVEDFYLPSGSTYLLRIQNPGDFMDDIWGYHGGNGTG